MSPLKGVRYRTVKRGGKTIRLAYSNATGKLREAKVVKARGSKNAKRR